MSTLKFAREPLSRWLREATPLIEKHWLEVERDHDKIKLAPDFQKWLLLERMGVLLGFSARTDDDKHALVGYAVFLAAPHLHYRDHTFAVADAVYIEPEYRRGNAGIGFLRFCDAELITAGVSKILHLSKADHDISVLLKRLGYTVSEHVYERLVI